MNVFVYYCVRGFSLAGAHLRFQDTVVSFCSDVEALGLEVPTLMSSLGCSQAVNLCFVQACRALVLLDLGRSKVLGLGRSGLGLLAGL